jgi:hypothetical protein
MGNKKLGEDEVRSIIREELKNILQSKFSYEAKFEPSDVLYMCVKNIIEESLGNSKHLRNLNIEFLVIKVLKDLLQPKLKGLKIELDIEPKIVKGG